MLKYVKRITENYMINLIILIGGVFLKKELLSHYVDKLNNQPTKVGGFGHKCPGLKVLFKT